MEATPPLEQVDLSRPGTYSASQKEAMNLRTVCFALVVGLTTAGLAADDPARHALPPPSPRPKEPTGPVLFVDDFKKDDLEHWQTDRTEVWRLRRDMLLADLPDRKQEHAILYAGSEEWGDYALEVDVCGMRGVDKGVVVRVEGETGIAVDLRGPGYQDVLLHRREWPMGRARVINGNSVWHHLRVEAQGHSYRVWVDEKLVLEREDGRKSRPKGRIALAAYTGGVGECTVYFDNVRVTALK